MAQPHRWVRRVVLTMLAAACVVCDRFPENRKDCDSSDRPCIAGDEMMANTFKLVHPTMPHYPELSEGEMGTLTPDVQQDWSMPEGYVIDFTGGYLPPPADYVAPKFYINAAGETAFIEKAATVEVTPDGFVPENISVLPGTTVTWDLQVYETASVRSRDNGSSFNSGPLNRNWAPTFSLTFDDEAEYSYRNDEVAEWRGGHTGHITVANFNCSSYLTCTTCLIYPQCMWCPGSVTCIEREVATNMPLDEGVVVAIPHVETREYQHIKFMTGFSLTLARMIETWFPWPPIRRNPKPVVASEVPAYFDPVSSDGCSAYMRTRDAAQCDDYIVPPPRNRVDGVETDRPELYQWSACYDHLVRTWATSDLPPPVAWDGWPEAAAAAEKEAEAEEAEVDPWDAVCCELCSACDPTLLLACNVTCADADTSGLVLAANATCPPHLANLTDASALSAACAARSAVNCTESGLANSTARCRLLDATFEWPSASPSGRGGAESIGGAARPPAGSEAAGGLGAPGDGGGGGRDSGAPPAVPSGAPMGGSMPRPRARQLLPSAPAGDDEDWEDDEEGEGLLETEYEGLEEEWPEEPQPAKAAHTRPGRRDLQMIAVVVPGAQQTPTDAWSLVPKWQTQMIGRITRDTDLWGSLKAVMRERFGPRCNATHRCDPLRGVCLNVSGLPIYAHDQNGTCQCHPWYGSDDCSQVILTNETCAGIGLEGKSAELCRYVRDTLFTCGDVQDNDALPPVCAIQGLSVVECGEAGHMKGSRDQPGIPNLIGRNENGYAAVTCAKCMGQREWGEQRPETYGKLCDRATVLKACQRHEDVFAQNVCNYCSPDTQGPVLPERGVTKDCSFYRGTCVGSVEKRIRGIVPPNTDIIGSTLFGGLRYCKKPSTFSSVQHYYTDEDIMQVGQSCRDGKPMFTNWDWSRQRDHPNTVLDEYGLNCKDPLDEATCPKARQCADEEVCFTDTPDWTKIESLVEWWGLEALRPFTDNEILGIAPSPPSQAGDPDGGGGGGGGLLANDEEEMPSFEIHKAVLEPQTAYENTNWMFLNSEYLSRYGTQVSWSVAPLPTPPSPPPPIFNTHFG